MNLQSEIRYLQQELGKVQDESLLRAIREMLNYANSKRNDVSLSSEDIRRLDARRERHLSGESKSYSWDEVKKKARSGE